MDRPTMLTIGQIQQINLVGTRMRDMCLHSRALTWTTLKVKSIWARRPEHFLRTEDLCPQVVVEVGAGGG